MAKKVQNSKWFVVEFKTLNKKSEEVEVFYNAVPESWVQLGKKPIVKWSNATSCSRDIMLGLPPKNPISEYPCKLLSGEINTFKEANSKAIEIFQEKKDKLELTTTEMESEEEDQNEDLELSRNMDFNKEVDELLNDGEISIDKLEPIQKETSEDKEGAEFDSYREVARINSASTAEQSCSQQRNLSSPTFEIPVGTIFSSSCNCYPELKDLMEQLLRITLQNQSTLTKLSAEKVEKSMIDKESAIKILKSFMIIFPISSSKQLTDLEQGLEMENLSLMEAIVSIITSFLEYCCNFCVFTRNQFFIMKLLEPTQFVRILRQSWISF